MTQMLLVGICAVVDGGAVWKSQTAGERQARLGLVKRRRFLEEQGGLRLGDVRLMDDRRSVVEDWGFMLGWSALRAGVVGLIGGQLLDGVLLALDHVLEAICTSGG